mmetsp:Transcript_31102/g.72335  ORF Transcript_31102/g.72335 Transcript_31102/m.72335 type:complete len:154 (+) Transcript_31102:61-522(+)
MPPSAGKVTEVKLVLLGDSNVGKSSLVLRFVRNSFNAEQVTTVGAAFLQAPVPLEDSDDKIQFGIWDTAGSERYKTLAPMVRLPHSSCCGIAAPCLALSRPMRRAASLGHNHSEPRAPCCTRCSTTAGLRRPSLCMTSPILSLSREPRRGSRS